MPILVCKRVIFYSPADEASFFAFAERITAVRRVQGAGDSILLHVAARPSAVALRDLLALFHRYRIRGISQLATFVTPANSTWFTDPSTYWHRRVFSRSPSSATSTPGT